MVLVTGAGGLSGSIVIREFARRGIPVKALVRNRAKATALETLPAVEIVEGDMLHRETLRTALHGVDRVLMISSGNSEMVETQCNFIDAARKAVVSHIVKFSGAESGVGFNAKNFRFTRMHEEIERYLEGSGVAWTHLRPSQFMQVYLREAPSIIKKGAFYQVIENVKLSPVDLEDVGKVAFGLLNTRGHETKSYDMTGPEALTMPEIAERISEAIEQPVRYINITQAERRQALLNAGVTADFADAMDEQASERKRCPESRVSLATHEMFGVKPTTFAEFAHRNVAVFRGEPAHVQ
jgi:uncharacterized protein YbjT (DUF2867 family)